MTTWNIYLPRGARLQIDADEIDTRPDGSLWLLASEQPAPLAVFARGTWQACATTHVSVLSPEQPATDEPPNPTPRFA